MVSCNVELSDPLYRSEGFMMFCYKILPCKKSFRHDWRVCPFAHGDETAKRRDPRIFKYTGVICPDAKKGRSCPRGDECPCTHSLFEYWLHPTRFKTEICSRGSRCNRPFCFFAHKQSEIRKQNFRVQMQGITCDPMSQHSSCHLTDSGTQLMSSGMHKTAPATANRKRASYLESATTPTQLFPSAALSSLSLEGSSISHPDSGSSCDVELSAATWNSWVGNDSPRLEPARQQQSVHHQGPISQNVLPPASSIGPMFPHIPTSEQNAVDWSIWRLPSSERQGSLSLTPMGYDSIWSPHPSPSPHPHPHQQQQQHSQLFAGKFDTLPPQTTVGLSPRFMETTHNVARTLKEPSFVHSHHYSNGNCRSSTDNGYDRNYLLATIRDVYQSMLPGCSPDQQSMMARSTSECHDGLLPCHTGLGTTGRVSNGGGYYGTGTNGTCGLEGLHHPQQNGCVSSNGITCNATNANNNDPNGLERIMYAVLKTDFNSAACYFK